MCCWFVVLVHPPSGCCKSLSLQAPRMQCGLGAGSLPMSQQLLPASPAAPPCQGHRSTTRHRGEATQSNFSVTYASVKADEKYLSKQISNAETLHKCWGKYFLRQFFSNWRETVISLYAAFLCGFLPHLQIRSMYDSPQLFFVTKNILFFLWKVKLIFSICITRL